MIASKILMAKLINSGGRIFYNSLKNNNVRDVFIYSGGSVMPLIDSLYKGSINYFVNSHEQNCGHAATGYAKTSDRTGVCIVTSGPGITNMITPLLDAKNDSTPLVVFSGQVSLNALGTNAFQEAPAIELTNHVTKWSYQIKDIYDMEGAIDEAFNVANNGKPGSVHIDIPKCVSYQLYNDIFKKKYVSGFSDKLRSHAYNIDNIKELSTIINNSEKPILYIGQGCKDSYEALRTFAIESNIPVTTTIHGCGIFDESHPLSLRWCGMHGNAAANYGLQSADTIIAIGSRFDDRTTGNISKYAPCAFKAHSEGKGGIIHVNINHEELGFVVDSHYNINTKSDIFFESINPYIEYKERSSWLNYLNYIQHQYPFEYKSSTSVLHMEHVLSELSLCTEKYTKDTGKSMHITTGVGNHQMQSYQFIKSSLPKTIISSGSLGVMGAGLGYSIGAQIANPDALVIDIDGDSSFNMTMSDLKTIKEHNLPVKIAIMNNNAQMMVTIWEQLFYEERYTATLNKHNPDYGIIAEGFGIASIKCTHPDQLKETIKRFINYEGPVLCEFQIEQDMCLPLVSPGCGLDEMILPGQKVICNTGLAPS